MNQGGWFLLLAYVGTNEPKGGGRGTWDISRFGEAKARIVEVVEGKEQGPEGAGTSSCAGGCGAFRTNWAKRPLDRGGRA